MSRNEARMDDQALDRLLISALRFEAERVAAAQPAAGAVITLLATSVAAHPARGLRLRASALAWLVLLLLAGAALLVVGTQLLQPDRSNPLVLGDFGPASACGGPIADGLVVEAFRDPAVLMIDPSGLVTVLSGDPADSPPGDEGAYRTRIESRFVSGVLTPGGKAAVLEPILGLGLDPGCYHVRTRAGDAAIFANTPEGPVGLSFSTGNGIGSVAPQVDPATERRLEDLLDALFALDTWVPAEAFTSLDPKELESWIVHTTFRPTGLEHASATVGGYDAVQLPGGAALVDFGDPIPGASEDRTILISGHIDFRTRNERCGLITRSDALALAASLDPVVLFYV